MEGVLTSVSSPRTQGESVEEAPLFLTNCLGPGVTPLPFCPHAMGELTMWPVGRKAGLGVESGGCCRKGSGRGGRFFSVPLSLCRRAGGTRRLAVGRVAGRKLTHRV